MTSPTASPVSVSADTVDSLSTVDGLDEDPFDDDLSAELAKRTPRGSLSRTTLALGGAVLIVGGFLGGVVVQKNWGSTAAASSANPAANPAANAGAGFAGRGANSTASAAPGAQRGATAPTTGTVKFVDGNTIYLTTAAGETITVKTNGTTTIRTEQTTAVADIPVGAAVSVQGTADADGNITATQVTATK